MTQDYKTLLQDWDVLEEQTRADFLEYLYKDLYNIKTGLYTGLWQRFCVDVGYFMRDALVEEELHISTSPDPELN
jgi:hypothetical protein